MLACLWFPGDTWKWKLDYLNTLTSVALLLTSINFNPNMAHMPSKVWDEITYPFPNFNVATVEVWEWINNFIPHFIMDVITHPCNHVSKRCHWWHIYMSQMGHVNRAITSKMLTYHYPIVCWIPKNKLESKIRIILSKNCIWKCSLWHAWFCLHSMSLVSFIFKIYLAYI